MSFEGYYQILCKNGHYDTVDCYIFDSFEWECNICKEKVCWLNQVDLTNGSHDDDGNRIDGYIELQEKSAPPECKCPTCGNVHQTGPKTYLTPTTEYGYGEDKNDEEYDDEYMNECLGI